MHKANWLYQFAFFIAVIKIVFDIVLIFDDTKLPWKNAEVVWRISHSARGLDYVTYVTILYLPDWFIAWMYFKPIRSAGSGLSKKE
jgi:hypothetical protein